MYCGGAKGEFALLEGLVHCFCRGCESAVAVGFQQTNVFGLQAFEFHGGKGSAGKWKASIKAFPDGFPPAEEEDEVRVCRQYYTYSAYHWLSSSGIFLHLTWYSKRVRGRWSFLPGRPF